MFQGKKPQNKANLQCPTYFILTKEIEELHVLMHNQSFIISILIKVNDEMTSTPL